MPPASRPSPIWRRAWEGVPDFEELERLLEDRKRIDGEMAQREKALKEARVALRDAGTNLSSLETRARQAWDDYSSARDRLVPLGPPAAGHDDLAAAWTGLAEWAAAEAGRLDTRVGEAEEQIKIAQATLDERRSALSACSMTPGSPAPAPPRPASPRPAPLPKATFRRSRTNGSSAPGSRPI
jgi:DNA repair protein SbcC/Rad50